jgi:poly(3-hydroxybutyrate) depolymerase
MLDSRFSMTRLVCLATILATFFLVGCEQAPRGDDDDSVGDDDDDSTPDPDPVAPLAELSDGECPDMSESGISSFSSGGVERKVAVVFPDDPQPGMPVVFNFHGLTNTGSDPVEGSLSQIQAEAEANDSVVIMPEARSTALPLIGEILIWGILDDEDLDLTLFDDLRTCASNELEVDLKKLSTWGHSGGALWSTAMLMERSTSLAAVVEFSGGAEFSIPGLGGPYLTYSTPERQVPVMLTSGGSDDSWPQGFPIVNFETTTETLAENLIEDGHQVARCEHQQGHYAIPSNLWAFSTRWDLDHQFGEDSPFSSDDLPDGCEMSND